MLTIIVPEAEFFDDEKKEFLIAPSVVLELEHSLVSVSKWEAKFGKPFLVAGDKEDEEVVAYIEAMVLSDNFSMEIYNQMSKENMEAINEYIASNQSATTFKELPGGNRRGPSETITSELIYFWMISYNVPMECENWHLNRLFSLLRICNVKNTKPKKMTKGEIAARNRELNAQRRAQFGTSG